MTWLAQNRDSAEDRRNRLVIISPALANANNGNWQTARRWQEFLKLHYQVELATEWNGQAHDAMIALHARRSAGSIAAFAQAHPQRPLVLVLTGTDLYRDIAIDAVAKRSLALAQQIVVLQEAGLEHLDAPARAKASVIYQSAPELLPPPRERSEKDRFEVVMIGHLREEKDPLTYMRAAALTQSPGLRLTHIGAALDEKLGEAAQRTAHDLPHYRWLGAMAHGCTRQYLRRSDLMVIASRMEGGANVIIEAVTSGVPVLASDISGNRGMLGADYAGYFPVGDGAALAALIDRAKQDRNFLSLLKAQCASRAPLFAVAREQAAVLQLMDNLLLPKKPLCN